MGWVLFFLLAILLFVALWRFGRFDKATLQFLAAGLFIAMAGYAWQGRPDLPGKPVPPPLRQDLPETVFAATRSDMMGQFNTSARWLTIADHFQRIGDTKTAADVIGAGLRQHPRDANLWVGLGNALVLHGDGMMNPAAELAFQRAAAIAPDHPAPKFFYGLALAQGGRIDEAEAIWRKLLETAPADAGWRPMVEERVALIERLKAASARPASNP